jgi:predicted enzyme related to lactoylglutathione lyase
MIEAGDAAPATWTVDFRVDDTDAAATRAAQLGDAVVVQPYDTPIFRQAVFADREGAIFSISQLRMRPS